ncbi:MAG: ABC transporter ATP-binding protein [Acidobacteria bacterium]|nr:ABC transporter ATP-binding protein [Acidobacteriota bacterium]
MNSLAIQTETLTRRFGELVAVDQVNMAVETGQFFGFLGPNGAGKSTTIKMLTGLLQPTGGNIRIIGHDLEKEPVEVKRRIGVVPEGLALFERLTGAEYLSFVGRMYGLDRKTAMQRGAELLDFMQLAERPKSLVADYSHGMKKKLALAAAVIHGPQVLFLDEPFEGVDAIAAGTLKHMLNRMVDRGVTIFLTSHVLEIVERLCSHVAIIHKGRIVAQGSIEELRAGVEARAAAAGGLLAAHAGGCFSIRRAAHRQNSNWQRKSFWPCSARCLCWAEASGWARRRILRSSNGRNSWPCSSGSCSWPGSSCRSSWAPLPWSSTSATCCASLCASRRSTSSRSPMACSISLR